MKCSFIKPDKQPCKANAIQRDHYCFWHSEQVKEQRKQATMSGGNSPKRSYGNDNPVQIQTTTDVLDLIVETINDLRQNRASTRLANAVGYLAGVALKALEQGDLSKRMEVIEYALKIKNRHR